MINGEANKFLSTLSLRRATNQNCDNRGAKNYFYPRSPCGERPDHLPGLCMPHLISIHALLAESDKLTQNDRQRCIISIHALLAESDTASAFLIGSRSQFLSTLSLRRATVMLVESFSDNRHFYPRSPCGERRPAGGRSNITPDFYPRSPCGERLLTMCILCSMM